MLDSGWEALGMGREKLCSRIRVSTQAALTLGMPMVMAFLNFLMVALTKASGMEIAAMATAP
jgi:hypothetical protein